MRGGAECGGGAEEVPPEGEDNQEQEENPPQSPFCKGGSKKPPLSCSPPLQKEGLGEDFLFQFTTFMIFTAKPAVRARTAG